MVTTNRQTDTIGFLIVGEVVTDEIDIGDMSVRGDIIPKNEGNSVSGANPTMDTIGKLT